MFRVTYSIPFKNLVKGEVDCSIYAVSSESKEIALRLARVLKDFYDFVLVRDEDKDSSIRFWCKGERGLV